MLAIDTNVVVRILTNDDPVEAERARRLVSENKVFVAATVLLESAWVLASRYAVGERRVAQLLGDFVGLPTVSAEAPEEVREALRWAGDGWEVADAFHLAFSRDRGPFATFDRKLLRQAREHGVAVVEP